VESLVVSSHGFSFFFYFVLEKISKITNTFFSIFLSLFPPYTSLFILWNLEELLTYTCEHTGKTSIASRPCGFDLFSLYAITEVSRKLKRTHFNSWFQNNTFCARFHTDQWACYPGPLKSWWKSKNLMLTFPKILTSLWRCTVRTIERLGLSIMSLRGTHPLCWIIRNVLL